MSKNVLNKTKKIKLKGFHGIDRSYYAGESGFERLENFRLDASGTLIKRPGRKAVAKFNHPICAAIAYELSSPAMPPSDCIVAEPPYLHAYNLLTGDDTVIASDLGSTNSKVELVIFNLKPYLFDGKKIRTLSEAGISTLEVTGYAPLYGKNWDPVTGGPVNEEPNLLGGELRINYSVKSEASTLNLGFNPISVPRVEINGVQTGAYYIDGKYVRGVFPAGSSVDVWVKREFEKGPLFGCKSASCVGGGSEERLIAYRNLDDRTLAFCSSPVSDAAHRESKKGFSQSVPLYFPESLAMNLGTYQITSVSPCGDSFMIFCENRTMLAKIGEEGCEIYTLSTAVGAVAPHATFSKGKQVFTFSRDGIYCFDVDLSEPYDTTLEKLSSMLEGEGAPVIDTNCMIFENYAGGELWFCTSENIYIYNFAKKAFYVYTGLYPRAMIYLYGSVYVFDWYYAWRFHDSYYVDEIDGETSPIKATAVSKWLDFGEIEKSKKNLTVHTVSCGEGNDFTLNIRTDSGLECNFEATEDETGAPSRQDIRIARCRFRLAKFSIVADTESRPKIYAALLTAQT